MKKLIITAFVTVLLSTAPGRAADETTNTYYQIKADFNCDGTMDVAVSTLRREFRNAGGVFTFYLCDTNGSQIEVGKVFMHPLAVNLKPVRQGEGLLKVYVRHEGIIAYSVTSKGIVELSRQYINPVDGGPEADLRLYQSLFWGTNGLKAELMTGNPQPFAPPNGGPPAPRGNSAPADRGRHR